MVNRNQKEQAASERHHFDVFLRSAGIQYLSYEPRDAPDFSLTLDDGRPVFVEHCELVRQELAEYLGLIDRRIVASIEKELKAHHVAVSVSLFWKKLPLSKAELETRTKDLETLAKELVAGIVKFVLSHEQDALRLGGLVVEDECLEQPLSSIGLDLLSAVYLDPQENPAGEAIVKSFPLDLQAGAQEQYNDLIERALEKKQRKLVCYRAEGAGEVWLLLVTGAGFNQPVIASLLMQRSFLSEFDRVYLLDLWSEQCLCLHST